MAGHGSLRQTHSRWSFDRLLVVVGCLFFWNSTTSEWAHAANPSTGSVDLRIDFGWDSDDARLWNVILKLDDPRNGSSTISELVNRSTSPRTTGGLEISEDSRQVRFQPRHAVHGGAIRFRVQASPQARLFIEFLGAATSRPPGGGAPVEIVLAELIENGEQRSGMDSSDGPSQKDLSWQLSRVAGDELRIEDFADIPVYEPNEVIDFSAHCNALIAHASKQLTLQYSLFRVSDGESIASRRWPVAIDSAGNCSRVTIEQNAPDVPGVYEVRCQLAQPDEKLWARLRRAEAPLIHVSRPIVVVSRQQGNEEEPPAPWNLIGEIRPSESTWSVGQWLPKQTTRFLPGSSPKPENQKILSSLAIETHGQESVSVLPPATTFQATLPVMTPGRPHRVTFRYPADRSTDLRLDLGGPDDRDNPQTSLRLTSEASENDGWTTDTFVYYPVGDDQLWMTNLHESEHAAFEAVSVEAGPARLASGTSNVADGRAALLRLDDFDWVAASAGKTSVQASLSECSSETIDLFRLWVAAGRIVDYTRAIGMNGIVVPASRHGRTWFPTSRFYPCRDGASYQPYGLAMFLRITSSAQLDTYVCLQPDMLLVEPESQIRRRPELTHHLIRGRAHAGTQYNLLQPSIQDEIIGLVGEVHQHCQRQANYSGIILRCDEGSHLESMLDAAADDGTLARYAESNGMPVDLADLRHRVATTGQVDFERWVHVANSEAYVRVHRSLGNNRNVMIIPAHDDKHASTPWLDQLARQRQASGSTRLVPGISFALGPNHILSRRPLLSHQLASASPQFVGNAVELRSGVTPRSETCDCRKSLAEEISRVFQHLDPSMLMLDQSLITPRLPDDLIATHRSFTSLPGQTLQIIPPVDPAAQTVEVKSGTGRGYTFVSITSLVPWTSEVDLETVAPVDWVRSDKQLLTSDDRSLRQITGTRIRVVVEGGQLVVLRSKTPNPSVAFESYTTRVRGGSETLEQIKQQVTAIVERIGILSDLETYDALANGGFELSGGMGLVGWLHAQHPPGCVQIDDSEFMQGHHSVRLTTDTSAATRTWIVSETIDIPLTGRLAVSLACRGEQKSDASNHLLRVSVEATRDGEPIRFTHEFEVPGNGNWGSRDVVLEAEGLEDVQAGSLRLTIDSLSSGRIWIDDVRLHDDFPTAAERAELQSQAFLAVQGLRKGNLAPSGRLLHNHWARRLLTFHSPETSPSLEAAKILPPESPGVAERLRSWLPRPLRF